MDILGFVWRFMAKCGTTPGQVQWIFEFSSHTTSTLAGLGIGPPHWLFGPFPWGGSRLPLRRARHSLHSPRKPQLKNFINLSTLQSEGVETLSAKVPAMS